MQSLESASELKVRSNFPGSIQTMRTSLRSYGIRTHRAAPKVSLTDAQIVDHFAFASSQKGFNWRNVVFSDEVTVSSSSKGPVLVYRMDGFPDGAHIVIQDERSGRISVSCWGWMSYEGAGVLDCIHGKFTTAAYLEMLKNVLVPPIRRHILKEHLCTSRITIQYTMPTRFKGGFVGDVISTSWRNLRNHLI